MFVHSGASLHGHEFSSRSPAGNQMHTTQRFRSALATQNHSPSPTPSSERTITTTTPSRRLSLQSNGSPVRPDTLRNRPVSDIAPRKEQVVRFTEQPSILSLEDLTSEDDTFSDTFSDIASLDGAGQRKRRSKRTPKPATNYLLAYPPPRLRTKQRRFVQIRPRLLLQLQQLSADKRPKPMLDVLPSRVLTGTHIVPRLARRCPELFKLRGHLGLDDLVVAKSEDFDSPDENINVKNLDKRDLIAVISPVSGRRENDKEPADRAEIVLTDGSLWTASSFTNGFEFQHVDVHGITKKARWVKKSSRKDRDSIGPISDMTSASTPDYKFTFSMIDPSSRRHPVMATLTSTNLEILDHYTIPPPASNSRRAAVRPFSLDMAEDAPPVEKSIHPVDEATRTLIAITSIWVSFRHGQGWGTTPRPTATLAPPLNTRVSSGSMERARANTYPVSPADSNSTSPMTQFASSNSSSISVLPRRALSTGAAYMQRRQARLGHDSPPLQVASLAESDEGTDDSKPPSSAEPLQDKKPGIYRRIRNWGHRLSTSGKKRDEE